MTCVFFNLQQENVGPIPGYLSLHQEGSRLLIKWTPNQMMNVKDDDAASTKESLEQHEVANNGANASTAQDESNDSE